MGKCESLPFGNLSRSDACLSRWHACPFTDCIIHPTWGTPLASSRIRKHTPGKVEALLVEMAPEIRATDRDMREIEILEEKGVTAAAKLARKSCTSPSNFGEI